MDDIGFETTTPLEVEEQDGLIAMWKKATDGSHRYVVFDKPSALATGQRLMLAAQGEADMPLPSGQIAALRLLVFEGAPRLIMTLTSGQTVTLGFEQRDLVGFAAAADQALRALEAQGTS